jgi:quercetin dioxygenase-like cupin family protein
MIALMLRLPLSGLAALSTAAALFAGAGPALAQATSRPCPAEEAVADAPGPACSVGREDLAPLEFDQAYWHLDTYPTRVAAQKVGRGTVVEAFGKVWLFTIADKAWRAPGGAFVAAVGPLAVKSGESYAADYLRSTFAPGMTAPVHMHSGPEAFYALGGETCLETPDGAQRASGPGHALTVRAGPPMLLMATGSETRRGFALVLHDAAMAPTTMVHDWAPKGLCKTAP